MPVQTIRIFVASSSCLGIHTICTHADLPELLLFQDSPEVSRDPSRGTRVSGGVLPPAHLRRLLSPALLVLHGRPSIERTTPLWPLCKGNNLRRRRRGPRATRKLIHLDPTPDFGLQAAIAISSVWHPSAYNAEPVR